MAETLETLEVLVRANDAQLRQVLKRIESESADTGQKLRRNLDFGQIGASLTGLTGGGGIIYALQGMATESAKTEAAWMVLQRTITASGGSFQAASSEIDKVAQRLGLAPAQIADSFTQLTRAGYSVTQISDLLVAGGASALAFGRDAAAGVENVTSALVTGQSMALNAIGISENLGPVMKKAATETASLSAEQQKAAQNQAAYNLIVNATGQEVESLDVLLGGLIGKQSEMNREWFTFRDQVGQAVAPVFQGIISAGSDTVQFINAIPEPLRNAGVAAIAAGAGATALAGAVGTLMLVLAPLSGPTGLLILAATAAGALASALGNIETPEEKLKRYSDELATATEKSKELANVTSAEQLQTSVKDLAGLLDGEAKQAFINYATEVQNSNDKLDAQAEKIQRNFALQQRNKADAALVLAENELETAQRDAGFVQQAQGTVSPQQRDLTEDKRFLQEYQAEVKRTQEGLDAALKRGDNAAAERWRSSLAEAQKGVADFTKIVSEGTQAVSQNSAAKDAINAPFAAEVKGAQANVAKLEAERKKWDDLAKGGVFIPTPTASAGFTPEPESSSTSSTKGPKSAVRSWRDIFTDLEKAGAVSQKMANSLGTPAAKLEDIQNRAGLVESALREAFELNAPADKIAYLERRLRELNRELTEAGRVANTRVSADVLSANAEYRQSRSPEALAAEQRGNTLSAQGQYQDSLRDAARVETVKNMALEAGSMLVADAERFFGNVSEGAQALGDIIRASIAAGEPVNIPVHLDPEAREKLRTNVDALTATLSNITNQESYEAALQAIMDAQRTGRISANQAGRMVMRAENERRENVEVALAPPSGFSNLQLDENLIEQERIHNDFTDNLANVFTQGASDFYNALKDGKLSGDEAGSLLGNIGSSLLSSIPGIGFLAPLAGMAGGMIGNMLGGNGDAESRAQKELERRGGASSMEINLNFYQTNRFERGLDNPENQRQLNAQGGRALDNLLERANLGRLQQKTGTAKRAGI